MTRGPCRTTGCRRRQTASARASLPLSAAPDARRSAQVSPKRKGCMSQLKQHRHMEVHYGPERVHSALLRAKYHVPLAVTRRPHPARTRLVPGSAVHVHWVHRVAHQPGGRLLHRYGLKLILLQIKYLQALTIWPDFVFLLQSCPRISRRTFALTSHGLYIRKNTKINRF